MKNFIQPTVILLLIIALIYSHKSKLEIENLNESLNSEIIIEKNEKGQEKAKRILLEGEKESLLLNLKTKDTSIMKLQSLVKKYKGKLYSATVLSNETTVKGSGKTEIIIKDSLIVKEHTVFPTYKTNFSNEWEDVSILANKDSITWNSKITNRFEITFGADSNGWFKKRTKNVSILNLNPNTKTKELRSFMISNEPKRLTIGLQAGYGLGLRNFETQPFIGIGVNYTILSIK